MSQFVIYLEDDTQDIALETTLSRSGMTVFRCETAGMGGASDQAQLDFATAHGYVLYTANVKDFAVLHRQTIESGRSHAGIIYRTKQRYSVGEQARRILHIWQTLSAAEMVNRYESISQWDETAQGR